MFEVTLIMDENELLDIMERKLSRWYSGDEYTLYWEYISTIVRQGSATIFFGPTNIDNWLKETVERLRIVKPGDDDYVLCDELWNSGSMQKGNMVVQYKYGNRYLVEEI